MTTTAEVTRLMDHIAWEDVARRNRVPEDEMREELAGWYADSYISSLRERFAKDEIDLDDFEAQVALVLRGIAPIPPPKGQ